MKKFLAKSLLFWEKMLSIDRYNQMLLFHVETELIFLSQPMSEEDILDNWALYKKNACESYWDLKNRIKSSNLSRPGQWILLNEIDEQMARFIGK
jgi:hypothetical protein